jgi:hypothetical protein
MAKYPLAGQAADDSATAQALNYDESDYLEAPDPATWNFLKTKA